MEANTVARQSAIIAGKMKDELRSKIQAIVDRKIRKEMQVVYLLVEARKLMDRESYTDPVLRTFSNWVVHTSLENRADGSTLILKQFDSFMAQLYERQSMHKDKEHISLGSFFKHFHLNASFLKDLKELKIFFSLYCSIVSECPLVFTASKEKLKYIKKVELTGVSRGLPMKEWPVINWKLTFHDGSTHNWGFHLQ
jgi:hypothetical protein